MTLGGKKNESEKHDCYVFFCTPSFAYSSNRSNTFDHSSPPNYYQLALQQEEENRDRQNLFSLIYSSSSPTSTSILLPPIAPPNHPPPSIPTTTTNSNSNSTETTTTFLETYYNNQQQQPNQQKLRIDNSVILNNNLRPPSFKHLRSVSTDASFESRFSSSQRFQESEEREGSSEELFISDNTDKTDLSYCEDSFNDISIDLNNFLDNQIERMKPPLEMAKEKRKLVVLNDLEKSSKDFSLSG
uniref:Uncharacterized protein n=1 Tax=Panagrolaimus sp. PS1159 TaxID=55785 RepID=A0AC35FHE7_9BILA